MHPKLPGNLVYRLDSPDRFKRHLGFELTTEILAFLLTHCLLLFIAGYHLKSLSSIWGPLYFLGGLPWEEWYGFG